MQRIGSCLRRARSLSIEHALGAAPQRLSRWSHSGTWYPGRRPCAVRRLGASFWLRSRAPLAQTASGLDCDREARSRAIVGQRLRSRVAFWRSCPCGRKRERYVSMLGDRILAWLPPSRPFSRVGCPWGSGTCQAVGHLRPQQRHAGRLRERQVICAAKRWGTQAVGVWPVVGQRPSHVVSWRNGRRDEPVGNLGCEVWVLWVQGRRHIGPDKLRW